MERKGGAYMCCRFYISEDDQQDLAAMIEAMNRYAGTVKTAGEVRPTDRAAVLANNKALKPTPFAMAWGYTLPDGKRVINARSETAASKPLFRDGMAQRRCVIPASHYFEWQTTANGKIKFAIRPRDHSLTYLAGLYRFEGGAPVFTVLTRESAPSIAFIHDRMPVILPPGAVSDWLNLRFDASDVVKSAQEDVVFWEA